MSKKASKSKGNTGFRNKKLFCFNCGGSFPMPTLPIPVSQMTKTMESFVSLHADCLSVWKAPEPDMSKNVLERAAWWTFHGEQGTSSNTMWSALASYGKMFGYEYCKDVLIPPSSYRHPCDPDDFRRCYLLLKAVPEWKLEFHKLRALSPVWIKLVDNWSLLEKMLEEQMETKKPNGLYELMETYGC